MQIKPISDHILIEPIKGEEKSKGGILLPETAEKERSEQGKVVAVGPGKKNEDGKIIPIDIRVGQVVLFIKPYGSDRKIQVEDKECFIVGEGDILAILE